MEMESMRTRPLRVYFIPFFTPGHMIPFSEFARLFASRRARDHHHHSMQRSTPSEFYAVKKNPQVFHSDSGPYLVPGLPHPIKLPIKPPQVFTSRIETLIEGQVQSYGLLLNSFAEVDGEEYIEHYKKISGHKLWNDLSFKRWPALRDGMWARILWGSLPLARSRKRQPERGRQGKMAPKRVRAKNEGEQQRSGYNGMGPTTGDIEKSGNRSFPNALRLVVGDGGDQCRCSMITFPVFYEQFYNERLIAQVHGIGVEVGAQDWWETLYNAKGKLVSRDNIENAIRRIMDGGEEAKEVRRKARAMGENASEAVQEGGSSQKNLRDLIEDLKCILLAREQQLFRVRNTTLKPSKSNILNDFQVLFLRKWLLSFF
ncbi:hypothetical protein L6164_012646 [Bauhinia variegata]|uniref:Uncharacterized protein n=1 Tax=Bauhinia variegata TaxID=167791 RepID=A0ACB9PAM6_BAUVA|nr:hypothetical protein L6164_012646 [Bauhinia variegata]